MGLKIVISPAKKMNEEDVPPHPKGLPALVDQTRILLRAMKTLSLEEAQALWQCSDRLARLNYERFARMELESARTAAVVSYEGIQYQHLAAQIMDERCLAWLDEHLRILSGFYGILRPFDAVVPYRLEMQARLAVGNTRDLYAFWDGMLARVLADEGCDLVVNLASVEYAKAVVTHAKSLGLPVVTCLFGTVRPSDGKLLQRATEAKAARGTFVRWCAEQTVTTVDAMRAFAERGYAWDEERSDASTLVFVQS